MEYFTVLTNIGAQKIAAANAANSTINLSEIAVGDGNGVVPVPDISQEALVNEKFRAPLSELTQDEVNKNHFIARSLVPADRGNFWIREIGIYDVDGDLIAVGNYPETYKSILTDGAAKEVDLIVVFEVANADVVKLEIDPTVVMASQDFVNQKVATKADKTYVDEELAGISFITGFKNLIINGCKRVNQRGATAIDKTASAYNFDRWYYDGTNFIQYVEDKNIVLSGTYTLSWSGTATATVDGESVSNGGQLTLTANTQCEVKFNSSDFNFVQLEYGNKKTNFEIRHIGLELSLCQRYYEQFINMRIRAYHPTDTGSGYHLTSSSGVCVEKRVMPTITRETDSYTGLYLYFQNERIYRLDLFYIGGSGGDATNTFYVDAEIYPV
jgi:hypothetical protein